MNKFIRTELISIINILLLHNESNNLFYLLLEKSCNKSDCYYYFMSKSFSRKT